MLRKARSSSRGFSLVAALLLMLLVSALSVALMYSVNTEQKISGADQEQNLARYAAEAAMEKMTADVGSLYTSMMAPGLADISNLGSAANMPTIPGVTFPTYTVSATSDGGNPAKPLANTTTITSGQNSGLYAQTIPIVMNAVAVRTSSGAEVHITRSSEVVLIPVFQFGVFSDSDLSFFPGPFFDFNGRVFTNGNLFLAAQNGPLSFHAKMATAGDVVRTVLVNDGDATPRTNLVLVPTTTGGCDGGTQPPTATSSTCKNVTQSMSSLASGNPYTGNGSESPSWKGTNGTSQTFGGMLQSRWDGISKLNLPFVGSSGLAPWEIIKRPPQNGPDPASTSREYSMAEIRILLNDNQADLPGGAQAGDINLAGASFTVDGATAAAGTQPNYLAQATRPTYNPPPTACAYTTLTCLGPNDPDPGWFKPGNTTASTQNGSGASAVTWPLVSGWLRVEYRDSTGNYHNVTQEWLQEGFARGAASPNTDTTNPNSAGANTIHPNAILIFQKRPNPLPPDVSASYGYVGPYVSGASYNTNQVVTYNTTPLTSSTPSTTTAQYFACTKTGGTGACPSSKTPTLPANASYWTQITEPWAYTKFAAANNSQFGWFPINMYDPREGEFAHGTTPQANSCAAGGLMNTVELDMGNLRRWLLGTIPAANSHGPSVDTQSQNGYIVYFSDRRGMQTRLAAGAGADLDGEYGYEPIVDSQNTIWSPHGMETANGTETGPLSTASNGPLAMGGAEAGEDINGTTFAVNWGGDTLIASHGRFNLGNGFGTTAGGLGFANEWIDTTHYVTTTNLKWPTSLATGSFGTLTGSTTDYIDSPAVRVQNCAQIGQSNIITGTRHALKIVNGSSNHLPVDGNGNPIGITIASEQPVYLQGNYNADSTKGNNWGSTTYTHSPAAVIADAVTLLSNSFDDRYSLLYPLSLPSQRTAAVDTYFRVAMASGKNKPFYVPSWAPAADYGTDGGVHNFIRYLENWGNVTSHYRGSLVSMYYARYGNGLYGQTCNNNGTACVYGAPARDYSFDTDFLSPTKLPPGTPRLQDIDNLSFHQDLSPRTY